MIDHLKNEGYGWNHKKVHRIYRELGLNIRIKLQKRLPNRTPKPLCEPEKANISWSLDFMSDNLKDGRKFRNYLLREWCVYRKSYHSGAYPQQLRLDNDPELIFHTLADWTNRCHVELVFIQPGNPAQNAYIERINRTYREDVLDAYVFDSIQVVQMITEDCLEE